MDRSLENFHALKVLTLCGNYLKTIPGAMLPRSLQFLELYDNLISNVSQLVKDAPLSILHLGLGRNRLTNGKFVY